MKSEMERKVEEILWQISDVRGLESVCMIHSLLVEAAAACDLKFGLTLLSDIEVNGLSRDVDLSDRPFIYHSLYIRFSANIHQGIDPPDSPLNFQEEFPVVLLEILEMSGLSRVEIYQIFRLAIENVHKNHLWPVYENNVFVIAERSKNTLH